MDYPTSFQATDAFVYNNENETLLLGRKKWDNGKWRFVGGFVDPKDLSLEDAAYRERIEEAGKNLECEKPKYLFSIRIDDPRYRESEHKIMSAVFLHQFIFGHAVAGDDIDDGMEWFSIFYLRNNYLRKLSRAKSQNACGHRYDNVKHTCDCRRP